MELFYYVYVQDEELSDIKGEVGTEEEEEFGEYYEEEEEDDELTEEENTYAGSFRCELLKLVLFKLP